MGMGTGDWGQGGAEGAEGAEGQGVHPPNAQSPIPNPQSLRCAYSF